MCIRDSIVVELQSDTKEDMVSNVSRIVAWEKMWLEQHPDGVTNEYQGPRSDDEDDEDSE